MWDQACRIASATAVVVATDDAEIATAVRSFGGEVVMTSPDCPSGSDRCAEVARARDEAIVVNLQGDEPEFEPGEVDALVAALEADPSLHMGTLAASIEEVADLERASVVKVVCDLQGDALYFSRSRIPHHRDASGGPAPAPSLRHVGIYGFRRQALLDFAALEPTALERTEKLEQLRALENGWAIRVVRAERAPPGIDTPGDYEEFCRRMADEEART